MKFAAALLAFVALTAPTLGSAQTSDSLRYDNVPWRPDLIKQFESNGGQNIPNYLYTGPHGRHTAGGPCQMNNTTWRWVAQQIDIDIVKYDVAGSATEFDQMRACWKLWSLEGYRPWACCNDKLRQALDALSDASPQPRRRRGVIAPPAAPTRSAAATQRSTEPPSRPSRYREIFAASSDVYHLTVGAQSGGTYGIGLASR